MRDSPRGSLGKSFPVAGLAAFRGETLSRLRNSIGHNAESGSFTLSHEDLVTICKFQMNRGHSDVAGCFRQRALNRCPPMKILSVLPGQRAPQRLDEARRQTRTCRNRGRTSARTFNHNRDP
jgi:hypothetical protein